MRAVLAEAVRRRNPGEKWLAANTAGAETPSPVAAPHMPAVSASLLHSCWPSVEDISKNTESTPISNNNDDDRTTLPPLLVSYY